MSADRDATMWAATWVPSPSPIDGFGPAGYSVSWVDVGGERIQVLVDGDPPAPGVIGRIEARTFGEHVIDVFVAGDR